jgi:DNA topoisomerase-3
MDAHGIGTDATIAQHIKTIVDRKYAEKTQDALLVPTVLGVALTDAWVA